MKGVGKGEGGRGKGEGGEVREGWPRSASGSKGGMILSNSLFLLR